MIPGQTILTPGLYECLGIVKVCFLQATSVKPCMLRHALTFLSTPASRYPLGSCCPPSSFISLYEQICTRSPRADSRRVRLFLCSLPPFLTSKSQDDLLTPEVSCVAGNSEFKVTAKLAVELLERRAPPPGESQRAAQQPAPRQSNLVGELRSSKPQKVGSPVRTASNWLYWVPNY